MHNLPKNFFRNCESLTSITLPSTISSIGDQAMYRCRSLKEANIGTHVKFIGLSAFTNDAQLTSIDRLNDSDGSHTFDIVCDYAFAGTGIKKANLSLRSSSIYTFWGDGCFQDCKDLEEVHVLSANYLSRDMFKGCTKLSKVTFDKNFMAYTYPGVFQGCTSLTSIVLPAQLIFATTDMFKDCTNLKSVYFNEYDADGHYVGANVKLIQKDAFNGCKQLNMIQFPSSIQQLDQIDDGAFNGLFANQRDVNIVFPGLKYTDIGSPIYENELYYGEPIELDYPEDLLSLLHQAYLIQKPFLVLLQFTFSFVYSTNPYDRKTVYMHDVTSQHIADYLPYQVDTDPFFNSEMDTSELEFDGTFTYNGTQYDLTDKSIVIATKTIDLGTAVPYVGRDYREMLNITNDNSYNAAMKYIGVMNSDDEFIDDRAYPDDLTDAELTKMAKKYSSLASRIRNWQANEGQQRPCIAYLVKQYLRSLMKWKKSKDMPPKTIDQMIYYIVGQRIISTTTSFCVFINYGKSSAPIKLTGISFNYTAKCAVKKNKAQTLDVLYKILYTHLFKNSNNNKNMTQIGRNVIVDTNGKYNHVFNVVINNNGFYRAFPRFTTNINDNVNRSFPLTITTQTTLVDYERYSRDHNIKMVLKSNTHNYVAPTQYNSDKSTIDNFQVGHWYYNARQLHNYAKNKHIPCLFIYSLLGCGPCAIYQKNIWNNPIFQEWSAKQKFFLCGMEVEKQPLFDAQLQFCSDELSPNATNFAKRDNGERVEDKTPNVFGEVFYRYATADGALASTLMTPVLVFMDKDGRCVDYTFHNIGLIIQNYGANQVIDFIKRMCLYMFDNNSLDNAQFVVDCDKPFYISDFPKPAQSDNSYVIADKLVDFQFTSPEAFNAELYRVTVNLGSMNSNSTAEEAYKSHYGNSYTAFPFIGGCLWADIDYFTGLFDPAIQSAVSASQMMLHINNAGYKFKFGEVVYSLSFNDNYSMVGYTPCGESYIAIPIWTPITQ